MLIHWRPVSLDNDPCDIRALLQLPTLRMPEAETNQMVLNWLAAQVPLREVTPICVTCDRRAGGPDARGAARSRGVVAERELGSGPADEAGPGVSVPVHCAASPRAKILLPLQVMPLGKNAPDRHCVAEWTQRDIEVPVAAAIHAVQHQSSALRTHAEAQQIVLDTEAALNTSAHLESIRLRLQTQKAILRLQAGAIGDEVHVQLLDRKGQLEFDEDVPCTAGPCSTNKRFRS